MSDGRITLNTVSLKNRRARNAGFEPWVANGRRYRLHHKMVMGLIDFRITAWSQDDLAALVAGLPDERRVPEGWNVDLAYGARKGKESGVRTPVLRHAIEQLTQELPPFEEAKPIIASALRAILKLRWCFDAGGATALEIPPSASIDHHLNAAARLARIRGMSSLAEAIEGLGSAD